jgi:pimeloyl-ACP methyl ester carboxylesterase
MPHLTVGGSRLYFESHGDGPAVVLVHGVGGNHVSWFNQVPYFSRSYRVVTIDQRGFGLSEDAEGLGRSAMAGDLLHVLDHLGIERAALVAQSMGGGTCANVTCTAPGRIAALVMADTVLGLVAPPALQALSDSSTAAAASLTQAERVLGPDIRRDDPERVFLYLQIAGFNRYNARTVAGQFPRHEPAALAATGVPVLFLVGAEDVRFPAELVRGMHVAVAGSRYVEIPSAGHSAYFERPDVFNSLVAGFLAETWPAAAP